jgi:hypothetical protein
MSTIYNSQLDAFELHHLVREEQHRLNDVASSRSSSSVGLEALGHAISGATGAALSNVVTYPLDLIITRLQIQRQLARQRTSHTDSKQDQYAGLLDAVDKIKNRDGWTGLYAGVKGDTIKTVLDVGGFFLVYSYLRGKLRARRDGPLSAVEELAVGWVSGASVKAVVMPWSVVVAQAQTRGMASADDSGGNLSDMARGIYREKGLQGFWAGYQAAMVLTLNPSLTFALHAILSRSMPRHVRDKPGAVATFLLSASSKAIASAVMYPFSLAKTRLMVGGKREAQEQEQAAEKRVESWSGESGSQRQKVEKEVLKDTLLSTLLAIVADEGYNGLYEGLHLEMCKGFLSHGITMVVKQLVQRVIIKLWYLLAVLLRRSRSSSIGGSGKRLQAKAKNNVEYFNLAMARAGERLEEGVRETVDWTRARANETAEFVHEYVEEESPDWQNLYGPLGLSKWLDGDRKAPK